VGAGEGGAGDDETILVDLGASRRIDQIS